MKRKPTMDLCFFKLRHSHKSNFQITTTQIPLKKQRKNQIPLWWVHEPSLRVNMKRWGGYMGFAVGVYETGLYVENVHPNKWDLKWIFAVRKWNHTREFFDKHQPIKIILSNFGPTHEGSKFCEVFDGADSNVAHSSMATEDTWAASSANVYTGWFRWQVVKPLKMK